MSYLDAWNVGFEEGKQLPVKLINEYCAMQFESLAEVINYIKEAKSVMELTDV